MLYYSLNGININHLFLVWTYLSTPTHDSAMIGPGATNGKGGVEGRFFQPGLALKCPCIRAYRQDGGLVLVLQ